MRRRYQTPYLENMKGTVTHLQECVNNGIFGCGADMKSITGVCKKFVKLPARKGNDMVKGN